MRRPDDFDESYYRRFYLDPTTRVETPRETAARIDFVASYVRYLDLPVRRILDVGCGLGLWRAPLERHFPRARYLGVEVSEYLCARQGWRCGSVVDFRSRYPFDLVICADVLQYLDDAQASAAIDNLGSLCRGVLYFAALTRADWTQNCDRERSDGAAHLRSGAWYRRRLRRHFIAVGGGVFLGRGAPAVLFELERLD